MILDKYFLDFYKTALSENLQVFCKSSQAVCMPHSNAAVAVTMFISTNQLIFRKPNVMSC